MPSRQRHRRKAKRIAACRPQAAIRCCRQPKGGKAAEKEAAERQKKHTECAVPVGTNFLLGRAKSCQWQVFVRRRPPKQGELRTDVSKATMFQGDRKVTKFFPYFCALQKVGKDRRRAVQKPLLHSGQHAPRALRRRFAAPFGGFAASFAALRWCPCRDGTLRVLFFAACSGFIFVAAATNFAASREYACSASKNTGKSNAFAGIPHKFLISFL